MFDFGWDEMALFAAVALVVLGPKELPKVMRTAGQWTRKMRMLAGDFQRHIDDMVRESELEELREQARKAAMAVGGGDVGALIEKTADPDGDLRKNLTLEDHGPEPLPLAETVAVPELPKPELAQAEAPTPEVPTPEAPKAETHEPEPHPPAPPPETPT